MGSFLLEDSFISPGGPFKRLLQPSRGVRQPLSRVCVGGGGRSKAGPGVFRKGASAGHTVHLGWVRALPRPGLAHPGEAASEEGRGCLRVCVPGPCLGITHLRSEHSLAPLRPPSLASPREQGRPVARTLCPRQPLRQVLPRPQPDPPVPRSRLRSRTVCRSQLLSGRAPSRCAQPPPQPPAPGDEPPVSGCVPTRGRQTGRPRRREF